MQEKSCPVVENSLNFLTQKGFSSKILSDKRVVGEGAEPGQFLMHLHFSHLRRHSTMLTETLKDVETLF
ncbi:unnamed protein product [Ilex paraguariensis]|uniref:Uncharacterized protein n=1 Tax=Ilex paraguariensis TaxID=185542 RepID=A0ABC8RIX9_9AQUA